MLGRPATPPTTPPSASFRNLSPCPAFRNLGPDLLAGVIFTCTDDSFDNCIEAGVFGLPRNHFQYVQYVRASMVLFLFNYSTRELHGIFRAVTQGKLDGRPGKVDPRWASNFPAQVYVDTSDRYPPLPEPAFKLAIMDNYHTNSSSQFVFELDTEQVARISELFKKFSSAGRFSPPPQLSPLAHSPPPPAVNNFAFLEGALGNRSPAAVWDGLAGQGGWNPGELSPSNRQPWDSSFSGQAANVSALNAHLTQDLSLNYNQIPIQRPQQTGVWPIGHQSPTAGSSLGGLAPWVQSPVHADASPGSQVWANLGGPLSPVVALTPRATTPGGSTTPTGVWGQPTIWSARPGDPFGGLSWTSGQSTVGTMGGVGLSLSDANTDMAAALIGADPTPVDNAVDRRGWGSLLDGSGGLVELKASDGGSESLAKNADKLITFGSLVAKEEDLEALLEAEEECEAADTHEDVADGVHGYEPVAQPSSLYKDGGAQGGWKDEHGLVTHGWSDVQQADGVNGKPSADSEPHPTEDKMLERISSLPRIKTGRDVNGTAEMSQVIAAINEVNGEIAMVKDPAVDSKYVRETGDNIQTAGVVGSVPTNLTGSPALRPPVHTKVPPGVTTKHRDNSTGGIGAAVPQPGRDGQNDPSEGTTVQSLEVYKNAIENLTSEVKSLKHENTELKKDRDSIKAQLERTQMRLFLMRDKSSGGGINTDQSEDQSIKESLKQEAEPSNPPVSEDSPSLFDLWVVGGVTSTQKVSRRMDIFQPDTNGWLNGPAVPMGLCYGAAVAHGPYMFVLGGVETDDPYTERSNMWNINLQTGAISDAPSLMEPRTRLGAAKVGSQIYAIGGQYNSRALRTVEIYDPVHDCWLPGPPLKQPRRSFGIVVVDGSVYAVGGIDKNNVIKSVEMMDPREGQWQVVGSLNEPRGALACAPLRGNFLVIGGYSEGEVLTTAEVLDVRSRSSIFVPEMKQARSYCTATTIDNHIYVVGGRVSKNDDDSTMATMECFNIDEMSWMPNWSPGEIESRAFHAACVVKRQV